MATLPDTLAAWMDLGAVVPGSDVRVNHLLCVDDTCITAHSPAAFQQLLNVVQQWLDWTVLKAKLSNSRILYIEASLLDVHTPSTVHSSGTSVSWSELANIFFQSHDIHLILYLVCYIW